MSRCKPSIGAATINAFEPGLTLAQLSNKSATATVEKHSADKHNPFMRLLSPYRYLLPPAGGTCRRVFSTPRLSFWHAQSRSLKTLRSAFGPDRLYITSKFNRKLGGCSLIAARPFPSGRAHNFSDDLKRFMVFTRPHEVSKIKHRPRSHPSINGPAT